MTYKPNSYKLPRCWLGQMIEENGTPRQVTENEINPKCRCTNAMQAFMCSTGHLTECHAGMDCQTARCSHLPKYLTDDELEQEGGE